MGTERDEPGNVVSVCNRNAKALTDGVGIGFGFSEGHSPEIQSLPSLLDLSSSHL